MFGLLLVVVSCSDPAPQPVSSGPPTSAEAIATHNAAVAAMGRFDYPRAFALLEPLVGAHPQWLDGQVDLSIAQLNRQAEGDESAALARLDAVIRKDADNLRAQYTAGVLRMTLESPDAAIGHFRRVAEADAGDAYAAYYVGQSLSQMGQPQAALPWFERAIQADPYLRSSYYAGAQAARRASNDELANTWLQVFQRMEHNPRARLAEIKYTRMGPRAELATIGAMSHDAVARPKGDVFAAPRGVAIAQHVGSSSPRNLSIGALGSTGEEGSLVLEAREESCRVYLLKDGGELHTLRETGLEGIGGVQGALWGDIDADGHVDVVLLRDGMDQLWMGRGDHRFERDGRLPARDQALTVDGALFDADHDGDLDVLVLQDDGHAQLLNNNGNGTWRALSDEATGFPASGGQGRHVVVADFDGDLDTDVLLLNAQPPHAIWLNDRLWHWHGAGPSWAPVLHADMVAAVAADWDADGEVELVAQRRDGVIDVLDRVDGEWSKTSLEGIAGHQGDCPADPIRSMAVLDLTGDGRPDVLASTTQSLQVMDHDGFVLQSMPVGDVWTTCFDAPGSGPALLSVDGQGLHYRSPGAGRFAFVDVALAGRTHPGQSMRSNASGIGAVVAARVGTRWAITAALRSSAGPGQSLQPLSIGLGGASAVDFVAIDWTDGVFQTEADLGPGRVHELVETQRQLSSCPVLFGFDGERMAFMTDCLGVGGIGFLLKPGHYAPSRPWERVLLPEGALAPREGALELIIAEPMQETCYLDEVSLLRIDLPLGWEVLPDERMGTGGTLPTGELFYSQHSMHPVKVHTDHEGDVTDAATQRDGRAIDPGPLHRRFIGRTVDPLVVTALFDQPFDAYDGVPLLVLDAWVEYPYAQTMFAAWQAGVAYEPFSLEVLVPDGSWVPFGEHIGYPAGMPRTMVVPLKGLPSGVRGIRLHTTLACTIDRLRVAWAQDCQDAVVQWAWPSRATLFQAGYPRRIDHDDRRPDYDWTDRRPFWDTRTQQGLYTALGDVRDLVRARDGVLAVLGPGDAVALSFKQTAEVPQGMHRQFVLDLGGWAKDMDFMTRSGSTVDPLPGTRSQEGEHLQQATRTRFRDGR
jgi:hypothetical protein